MSNTSTVNTDNKNNKQYVYDAQLKCYFDPETNEYFELKSH